MKILGIIPARFGSSRFEGKPLVKIDGISMIERVYRQCEKCTNLDYIAVATDDKRIENHVVGFGGNVVMTSKKHSSGTERCAEALEILFIDKNINFDVVINIQGDEPFINPQQIDKLASIFNKNKINIATLKKKINSENDIFNPNVVKIVTDNFDNALYFSRSPIPYLRGIEQNKWIENNTFYKHIGIYAYSSTVLKEIVKLKTTKSENSECLEQLRWLENGFKIKVLETEFESISVDTPEDIEKIKYWLKQKNNKL